MSHDHSRHPCGSLHPVDTRVPGPTERWIDDELAQSFPASDPPSWTMGTAYPEGRRDSAASIRRFP